MSNFIELLFSVMSHCSFTFYVDFLEFFIEKTTFEEICEQVHREKEIQFNDEKELIDSIH